MLLITNFRSTEMLLKNFCYWWLRMYCFCSYARFYQRFLQY